MENLYTVQKTYEALVWPVRENDQTRIFENEYARKMYYAWLTKASVRSAINWLKRPESAGVADHGKMLQLLEEKLENISRIQAEVRAELRANPFVINALIPKGDGPYPPIPTAIDLNLAASSKGTAMEKKEGDDIQPPIPAQPETSASIINAGKKRKRRKQEMLKWKEKKITTTAASPAKEWQEHSADFSTEIRDMKTILAEVREGGKDIHESVDRKIFYKWSKNDPEFAQITLDNGYIKIWWRKSGDHRPVYILREWDIVSSLSIDSWNTRTDLKRIDKKTAEAIAFLPPLNGIIIEKIGK